MHINITCLNKYHKKKFTCIQAIKEFSERVGVSEEKSVQIIKSLHWEMDINHSNFILPKPISRKVIDIT